MAVTKKALTITAAIAAVAVAGSIALENADVKVCPSPAQCATYSKKEYQDVKHDIVRKVEAGEELTVDEWQAYVVILDRELKRRGGISIHGKDGKPADVRGEINKILLED